MVTEKKNAPKTKSDGTAKTRPASTAKEAKPVMAKAKVEKVQKEKKAKEGSKESKTKANLFALWQELLADQTDKTVDTFWKEYSEAETLIYKDILSKKDKKFSYIFKEKAEEYKVSHIIFMGFLDGINSSLVKEIKLDKMDENSEITAEIDFEKLFFNMHEAKADYLYSLSEWNEILTTEKKTEIEKNYKRSKTVIKDAKIGRNDPCPCGSGKKFKKCCGK